MVDDNGGNRPLSEEELQELVASSDAGARNPVGSVGTLLAVIAVTWSLFQVLLASPISNLVLPGSIINNSRLIHLAFAMFLAYTAYPALKSSPRHYIPIQDWIMACAGAFLALYGYFFYEKVVKSGGLADDTDKWFALLGLILLFEGARRALGPAMAIIATIFLLYVFYGSSEIVPDVIRWKGASLKKAMSHMWITSEGVFGIALGVSTRFVFLFVLFGSLLDKAGAGNYFIKMAFGALGHLKGGPAKAAVVGSAATGLISGSSIANVVTTGTFTIPLMKRVGFSSEQAGAVEVASSVNGQIMPPVMGAAAFLMVEYVNISYVEVITHAFLPATISYIALVYIVHLEAVKRNMPTLGNRVTSVAKTVGGMFAFFAGFAALCYGVQYPVRMIASMVPSGAGWVLALLVFLAYVGLLWLASKSEDLQPDDPNSEVVELPEVGKIYASGLYYMLPIIVLVYFLMIEQKSPGLSAFWASMLLFVILLTQKPIKGFFRGEFSLSGVFSAVSIALKQQVGQPAVWIAILAVSVVLTYAHSAYYGGVFPNWNFFIFLVVVFKSAAVLIINSQEDPYANNVFALSARHGRNDLIQGMIDGARNMIGIGLATATAGVIVGTVTLTGIGQVMADLVEFLSGGNLVAMLILVGILSLILGMGLPTTANYIVVSSLMAGVVVELGAQNGLIVPLIAVHLFVFYFGIMADVTPPVGLASFAAAAISGGDAIKTGFVAFFYSLRTVALPFVFIFNTDLLLIDLGWGLERTGIWTYISPAVVHGTLVFISASIAILVFTSGTMGWFLTKSRFYESVALLLVAFMLFRPDFIMNRIDPAFTEVDPAEIALSLNDASEGDKLRMVVSGPDYDTGEPKETTLVLSVGPEEGGQARLDAMGLTLLDEGGIVKLDEPAFGSPVASNLGSFDFYHDDPVMVASVMAPKSQMLKELVFIPALLLLALIAFLQRARVNRKGEPA